MSGVSQPPFQCGLQSGALGASRINNTSYTNSSGKTMAVYITASGTAAWTCTGYCNGFPIGEVGGPGGVGNLGQLTFLVPNGQTYYVFNTGNVLTWYEQLIG